MNRFTRPIAATSFAFAFTLAFAARADQASESQAAATALFNEGKRLASDGSFAAACPKFSASYKLDPRVGTLLNLADCYEKNHQLASAWARFVEVRSLAARANQAEREQYAKEHVDALEPQLSKLTISVAHPSPGLVLQRDGELVDPATYGVAMPVDAGPHHIEVSAKGKRAIARDVTIESNADRKTIDIPALEDAPVAESSLENDSPSTSQVDARSEKQRSSRITIAIVAAGAGVAAAGVGTYFGVAALGKKSDSNATCGLSGNSNACLQPGYDARNQARNDGTLSTVFLGVGAALAVTGAVIWLTAPSAHTKTALLYDGRSVSLEGTF